MHKISSTSVQKETRRGGKDYSSIETLFKAHYSSLYAYGVKLCGDTLLVKDCIQDIFVSLCSAPTNTDQIQSKKSYLYTSLRRRILELKTSNDRRNARNQQFADSIKGLGSSPEQLIVNHEIDAARGQVVNEVIESLTERQKEAIYLRFYCNMSYEEIASIMDVREQSVRNQVFRVLTSLRKRFARHDLAESWI